MLDFILKIDRVICNIFRYTAICLLSILFILMALNVILRFFPVFSIGWFDEIVELSFAWLVFTTAAVLWRSKEHPQIDLVVYMFDGKRLQYFLLALIEVVNIFFLSAFTYFSYSLVERAMASSPIFQIPRKIFYVSMPAAGAYMTVVSVFFLLGYLRKLVSSPASKSEQATSQV
ncbi:TRAP transporter small permease [Polycladidibacter stylochi]|uniref:TRAP transporter small permease n=1 Tax=Polycladidibacter stylochi TaxID=1807766 RepID=UPI00082A8933|nr:TRAP transporter small permease subunit [Pseudovibrio stylochi]